MKKNIEVYLHNLLDKYLGIQETNIRIGAIVLGGLGDALDFWAWIEGCRKMFPFATIVAYSGNERNNTHHLLEKYSSANIGLPFRRQLKYFGFIPHTIYGSSWQTLVEIEYPKYDIFFDLRPYGCGIYKKDEFYCPDWFKSTYANMLSEHTANLSEMKLSVISLRNLATGIDGSYDDIIFPLKKVTWLKYPYITIHHGAQEDMKTKLWNIKYWNELAKWLYNKGYTVYQLGVKGEKRVKNAISLLGKTSIYETAYIIKEAVHHIDTEGGLVRLAYCGNIKTICTVLGGATPKELFSFPENNNIWLNVCQPCYCRVGYWNTACRWKLQGSEYNHRCMQKLYPEIVIESLKSIL